MINWNLVVWKISFPSKKNFSYKNIIYMISFGNVCKEGLGIKAKVKAK
jgi:hypothetical protein